MASVACEHTFDRGMSVRLGKKRAQSEIQYINFDRTAVTGWTIGEKSPIDSTQQR